MKKPFEDGIIKQCIHEGKKKQQHYSKRKRANKLKQRLCLGIYADSYANKDCNRNSDAESNRINNCMYCIGRFSKAFFILVN